MNECADSLLSFIENLEEMQKLEQYLNFEPVYGKSVHPNNQLYHFIQCIIYLYLQIFSIDVNGKLQDLKKLNLEHA